MNVDNDYQIGKDHRVCEDYSLSGKLRTGTSYAIVCDGCSASPDVDFGARILALSARETLVNHVFSPLSFLRTEDVYHNAFSSLTLDIAKKSLVAFPSLNPLLLDATLLIAWVTEKKLYGYLFGDGLFIHRNKNGIIKSIHINLSSGAPDYISYGLDAARQAAYHKIENNVKEVEINSTIDLNHKPFQPVILNSSVEEGDTIAVISDGINSFRKSNNDAIHWRDLVDEFTAFKTVEGEFVLRRLAAFKRKCIKEGINHHDDISVAAIVV